MSPKSNSSSGDNYKSKSSSTVSKSPARASENDATADDNPDFVDIKEEDVKIPVHAQCSEPVSCFYLTYFSVRGHFEEGTFSFS